MKAILFVLCLCIVTAAFSQRQRIQLNLSVGKTYSHVQQTKTIVIQTINGQDALMRVEMTAKTNYYVKSVRDTLYDIMVSYEKLVTKNNSDQGETEFSSDSSKHDITSRIFQAFVGRPFLVVMTKTGRILEMHVDSILLAAVNRIGEITQQQREMLTENLKHSLGGDAGKGSFEMLTAIYPSIPVDMSSSWLTKTKLQSLAMMDIEGEYTLKAIHPSSFLLHGQIDMVSQKQDSAAKINGLPLYYNLSGKMTTDFEVDKITGWISSGTISQSLKGTIKFLDSPQIPGGMEVPTSVVSEMSLSD